MRNRLLALLFSILSFAAPQTLLAEPVKYAHIKPSRKDLLYEFRESVNMTFAVMSQLNEGEDSDNFSEPIPLAERNRLRKGKTTFVSVGDRADQFVFDDPSLFKNLEVVSLASEIYNETYLKALALCYPDIEALTVSQSDPLTDEALGCLKAFPRLEYLDLRCPLVSPALLVTVMAPRIRKLQIADNWRLPEMAALEELDMQWCKLDRDYMDKLDAPRLERLDLSRVDVTPGSLKAIGRFKNLRKVYMYNSNIDTSDLEYLRPLHYTETAISGNPECYAGFHTKAEEYFQNHNFIKAIEHDQAVAFGEPTVYRYLQLARCYIGLGNKAIALEYCDYAATLDSTSPEIAKVRAEAETQLR